MRARLIRLVAVVEDEEALGEEEEHESRADDRKRVARLEYPKRFRQHVKERDGNDDTPVSAITVVNSPRSRSARSPPASVDHARRPVGIASVYRALEALTEPRLVKRVDAGDGIARYERAASDEDHHHHLVCRSCGKVEAFRDTRLERAIDRVAGGLGACADCS